MDAICRVAFGVKTDCQKRDDHPLVVHSKKILTPVPNIIAFFNIMLPELEFFFYPICRLQIILQETFLPMNSHMYINSAVAEIVDRRRKEVDTDRRDLLQALIDARITSDNVSAKVSTATSDEVNIISNDQNAKEKSSTKSRKLNDYEIIGNAVVALVAGYETTSTTLAFIAHQLVNYPDIQEKMREEILDIFAREGKLDYNTLAGLPLMEAVIQETLRLYPPVSLFVNRVAANDYVYKDKVIPKGTVVMAPVVNLQRDPKIWPEPNEFKPERFSKENKANVNWMYWQPFGNGSRNCVGMRFALLEMKLALAKLLLKYRLVSGPKTEIGEITRWFKPFLISPKNGVHVKVEALS